MRKELHDRTDGAEGDGIQVVHKHFNPSQRRASVAAADMVSVTLFFLIGCENVPIKAPSTNLQSAHCGPRRSCRVLGERARQGRR
jgi:hypothetical protein